MEGQNLQSKRLSESQLRAITEKMAEARQEHIYLYPWESLERDLKRKGLYRLPILGYGSLINPGSAAVTLRENSLSHSRPAIAFGARRLFNYEMPKVTPRYGPATGRSRAALNVQTTDKIEDLVNGILFEITIEEIPAFRAREIGYDLIPVASIIWNGTNDPPFLAYILSCPDKPVMGKRYTNERIVPHKKYYLLCRRGARKVSEDFLRLWLATTYLADGITLVSQWEVDEFPKINMDD